MLNAVLRLVFKARGTGEAQVKVVVVKTSIGHCQLQGGTVISQKAGFNCQPIGEMGRPVVPLGGLSAVAQPHTAAEPLVCMQRHDSQSR